MTRDPSQRTTFAALLRAVVDHQAVTPAQLARRSGVSLAGVCHLLAGERQPSLATAARLARALGVSIDSLTPDPLPRSER